MRRKLALLLALLPFAAAACSRAEARTSGVGDTLKPFIIKNCETGLQYCQVCAFSGKPTLMAAFDATDPKLDEDLQRLQRIVDAQPDKGVQAFAVIGKIEGDKLTPAGDEAAIKEKKKSLGINFPIVVLATQLSESEQKNYAKFADAYAVKGSRTIYLSNASGKVVHADRLNDPGTEPQFTQLEQAIKAL